MERGAEPQPTNHSATNHSATFIGNSRAKLANEHSQLAHPGSRKGPQTQRPVMGELVPETTGALFAVGVLPSIPIEPFRQFPVNQCVLSVPAPLATQAPDQLHLRLLDRDRSQLYHDQIQDSLGIPVTVAHTSV
jgi:hypothetical protein